MRSFPIEMRLTLFIFGYSWACVYDGVNFDRGKCQEIVGWIKELSGRQIRVPVVVGCRLFKIMVSLYRM